MEQLSNLDASFLYLDSPSTPMHIGCTLTFAHPASGPMTFARFERHIRARIADMPLFRQRLSRLPLDLDRPYWIADRDFNLGNHLQYAMLRDQNTLREQQRLINTFFSRPIDQGRPLWEMLFIENAAQPQSGFVVALKFHHAAVDGVSGERILARLLSTEVQAASDVTSLVSPAGGSATRMLGNAMRAWVRTPKAVLAVVQRSRQVVQVSRTLRRRDKQAQPPQFFQAPRTPYSGAIDAQRQLVSVHLSLEDIKEVKRAVPGCTVNDVVLAVCAGALRRQLIRLGQLPEAPLVAMVPVSKRESGTSASGNQISAMLVSLATHIADPKARLEAIRQSALKAKDYNREIAMEDLIAQMPSWSMTLLLKAYTRLRIGKRVKPVFNLVITNVPGAAVPLYLDGAELISMEGMAPIVDGMGLTLVVTSYRDALTVAVTTGVAMADQVPEFIRDLEASLEALTAALVATDVSVLPDAHVAGFDVRSGMLA